MARRRTGHSIDPPLNPNADEGNKLASAQLRRQSLQWQKHAQLGWPLKLNATRPHRQCPSVALVMIAPSGCCSPFAASYGCQRARAACAGTGSGDPGAGDAGLPDRRQSLDLSSAGQPGTDPFSAECSAQNCSADRQTSLLALHVSICASSRDVEGAAGNLASKVSFQTAVALAAGLSTVLLSRHAVRTTLDLIPKLVFGMPKLSSA